MPGITTFKLNCWNTRNLLRCHYASAAQYYCSLGKKKVIQKHLISIRFITKVPLVLGKERSGGTTACDQQMVNNVLYQLNCSVRKGLENCGLMSLEILMYGPCSIQTGNKAMYPASQLVLSLGRTESLPPCFVSKVDNYWAIHAICQLNTTYKCYFTWKCLH